jgi:hypothetical protein
MFCCAQHDKLFHPEPLLQLRSVLTVRSTMERGSLFSFLIGAEASVAPCPEDFRGGVNLCGTIHRRKFLPECKQVSLAQKNN